MDKYDFLNLNSNLKRTNWSIVDNFENNWVDKSQFKFKIIESPKKQTNLPLQTLFSEFVYYDGITFSKYQPEFNLYRNSFDDNDNKSEYWNCDACGGNSNTGCMSSTGDCYR